MATDTLNVHAGRAPHGTANGRGRNVSTAERAVSALGGALLAFYGVERRDVPGGLLALVGAGLLERGVTGHCHVYGALGVNTASGEGVLEQKHGDAAILDGANAVKVERNVTIYGHSPADLYRFWRNFENLPRIMRHLEAVTVGADGRSHWVAKAPAGQTVEWDAEIVRDVPDQLISWKSVADATVPNAGSVHFSDSAAGAVVRVELEYEPPAGKVGQLVAKLFGEEPDVQIREDLRRFKQMMEAGEIATSQSPTGSQLRNTAQMAAHGGRIDASGVEEANA